MTSSALACADKYTMHSVDTSTADVSKDQLDLKFYTLRNIQRSGNLGVVIEISSQ